MLPHRDVIAALGPHTVKLAATNVTLENGKPLRTLDEQTLIELGDGGAFHALYTNTADYGREAIFAAGKLFLRPRYQRWHERAPEAPDEPAALRDRYFEPIAAAWDLLAPGAEVVDGGAIEIAGRAGRKIELRRAPKPAEPPRERLAQRKWREGRTIEELSGEIVLDAEKGVPLAVKLAGAIAFSREGRRFTMKLGVDGALAGIGKPTAIARPAAAEAVATPERLREVDDRDYLLHGIAPPLRRNPDGTAATPAPPQVKPEPPKPEPPKPAPPKPEPPKPDKPKPDKPKPEPSKPEQPKEKP
jgi:hypothetical protein